MRKAAELYFDPPADALITDGSELVLNPEVWDQYLYELPAWTKRAIRLYQRCQMFKELATPDAGGVLDQSELTVQMLEVIYKVDKQHQERLERDARFTLFNQINRMGVEESDGGIVRSRS